MKEQDISVKLLTDKKEIRKDQNNEPKPVTNGHRALTSNYSDFQLQKYLLEGVSRTFALTIPQLPGALEHTVSNAYLLCRIVDTIEDEPALEPLQKREFCNLFYKVVSGDFPATKFSKQLEGLLSSSTSDLEKELIHTTDRVIRITHGFSQSHRDALKRCVRIMSKGMIHYQENASVKGLRDQAEMDDYCYHVAGVVGEMLTDLFCLHSAEIAANRDEMMKRAVSFGQGLQMTNILKDLWDDYERGACWLPRETFKNYGYSLSDLASKKSVPELQEGIKELIGITHAHLQNAFEYTLLIPPHEKGIRKFCLWAIGMAVLTLRKIDRNIDYTDSLKVKITRKSVKGTILLTNLSVQNDLMLRTLFNIARAGLPYQEIQSVKTIYGNNSNRN